MMLYKTKIKTHYFVTLPENVYLVEMVATKSSP